MQLINAMPTPKSTPNFDLSMKKDNLCGLVGF